MLQDFKMFHQIFEFVGDCCLVLCGEFFQNFPRLKQITYFQWLYASSLVFDSHALADFSMTDMGFFLKTKNMQLLYKLQAGPVVTQRHQPGLFFFFSKIGLVEKN